MVVERADSGGDEFGVERRHVEVGDVRELRGVEQFELRLHRIERRGVLVGEETAVVGGEGGVPAVRTDDFEDAVVVLVEDAREQLVAAAAGAVDHRRQRPEPLVLIALAGGLVSIVRALERGLAVEHLTEHGVEPVERGADGTRVG